MKRFLETNNRTNNLTNIVINNPTNTLNIKNKYDANFLFQVLNPLGNHCRDNPGLLLKYHKSMLQWRLAHINFDAPMSVGFASLVVELVKVELHVVVEVEGRPFVSGPVKEGEKIEVLTDGVCVHALDCLEFVSSQMKTAANAWERLAHVYYNLV